MNLKVIISFIAIFVLPVFVFAGQVTLNKQVDKPSAKPADIVTYSIAYQNPSTQTLTEVSIIDVIPGNTIFQEATGTNTTIYYSGQDNNFATSTTMPVNKVKWVINGEVEGGGSGTVTLRVKIK